MLRHAAGGLATRREQRHMFGEIRDSVTELHRQDNRPWLVGFSGGKAEPPGAARRRATQRPAAGRAERAQASANEAMVASLVVDAVLAQPAEARKKPVTILCTDTRVEAERSETPRGEGGNPAIVEMAESTLGRIKRFSEHGAHLVRHRWTRMRTDTGRNECHSELVEESLAWFGA